MGYCPYICILCKRIEDNGWGNRFEHNVYMLYKTALLKGIDVLEPFCDSTINYGDTGYDLGSDVCHDCLPILIPPPNNHEDND